MVNELKPCPFCGGTVLRSGGDDKVVGFSCLRCEASGPNHYGEFEWNTRADTGRLSELEAALRDVDAVACDFGHYEAAARTMKEIATKALEKLWSEK